MSLTKETKDYEILIRFNENGKIGVHRQTITEVKDGDALISSVADSPEPLSRVDLQLIVSALTDDDWFVPESEDQ